MLDELTALASEVEPADVDHDLATNAWAALPAFYPSYLDTLAPVVAERAILRTLAFVNRCEETPGGDSIPAAYLAILHHECYREQGHQRTVEEFRRAIAAEDQRLKVARSLKSFGTGDFASTPG